MQTTVELFAGIGGFRLAADRSDIETLWANDISPKACGVYRSRFGSGEIREGEIRTRLRDIPSHDLLTAGFPCQPFSSAGKKQGIKDPRGTLFSHVVEVVRKHHPQYFILENVKRLLTMERGVHFATILAALADLDYLIEWRLLNAVNFGLAQNRQRVFIIGTRADLTNAENGSRLLPVRLATPEDLSRLRATQLDWIRSPDEWRDISKHGVKFQNWGLAKNSRFFSANLTDFAEKQPLVMLREVLQDKVPSTFDFTESTLERIGNSAQVNRFVEGVEILSNQGGGARMGYTIFGINGIAPTLTSSASRHYERYKVGSRYRRLTNMEYARLQGFPDDYCSVVSVYDQYALYGNAVPPPMVEWVMGRLRKRGFPIGRIRKREPQRELFADV